MKFARRTRISASSARPVWHKFVKKGEKTMTEYIDGPLSEEELEKLRARNLADQQRDFDRLKLQADTIKHTTTLATGTIVIIAAFMDKLPKPLASRGDLEASVALMFACILLSFIHLWGTTLVDIHRQRHPLMRLQRGLSQTTRKRYRAGFE